MSGHKHKESMFTYAIDASYFEKPWELWLEEDENTGEWKYLDKHPEWKKDKEYSRKAFMSDMKGERHYFEFPICPTEEIEGGTVVFIVNLSCPSGVDANMWIGDEEQLLMQERGLVFHTQTGARDCADAMLLAMDLVKTHV